MWFKSSFWNVHLTCHVCKERMDRRFAHCGRERPRGLPSIRNPGKKLKKQNGRSVEIVWAIYFFSRQRLDTRGKASSSSSTHRFLECRQSLANERRSFRIWQRRYWNRKRFPEHYQKLHIQKSCRSDTKTVLLKKNVRWLLEQSWR